MRPRTSPIWRSLRCTCCLPASVVLVGCTARAAPVQLAPAPESVTLVVQPGMIPPGSSALVQVESPGADSIAIESLNGLDRWWSGGPRLSARVGHEFGDSVAGPDFAVREGGRLFATRKKPMKISVCRRHRCREYYRELPVTLSERNQRSVALTAGWSTALTKRALVRAQRSLLLEEVVDNGVWAVEAELASGASSARVQGFYSSSEYGGSLDVSRTVSGGSDGGTSYGVAVHLGVSQDAWRMGGLASGLTKQTAYQASIGPSLMLRGLTASSQIGVYTDGRETLQVLSTYISINGHLTEVRTPVSVRVEKTFAFGGGGVVPQRRDRHDRLVLGIGVVRNLAVRVGVSRRESTWPGAQQADDLRATETGYIIGGQYTLAW